MIAISHCWVFTTVDSSAVSAADSTGGFPLQHRFVTPTQPAGKTGLDLGDQARDRAQLVFERAHRCRRRVQQVSRGSPGRAERETQDGDQRGDDHRGRDRTREPEPADCGNSRCEQHRQEYGEQHRHDRRPREVQCADRQDDRDHDQRLVSARTQSVGCRLTLVRRVVARRPCDRAQCIAGVLRCGQCKVAQ